MRPANVLRSLILCFLALLLVLAQIPFPDIHVNADEPPTLSKWAANAPLIDGNLRALYGGSLEWDDAEKVDFVLSYVGETHNASLYVMNDYSNLYLAFVIEHEHFDVNDRVIFNFDNDHDGEKERGDDQLWISLDVSFDWRQPRRGNFVDGYFPTPSGEPSFARDVDDTGFQDGVGAASFTRASPSEPGDYIVEVAHPLDSGHDVGRHDFNLAAGGMAGHGDTIGINVLYYDGDAGVYGGWPTLTWSAWSQMATIKIASPPVQPPRHLRRDVEIYGIEITQAVQYFEEMWGETNSLPLAYGKSTIARVYIDLGFLVEETAVTVYLYSTSAAGDSLGWPQAKTIKVPGFLPVSLHRQSEKATANFLLPAWWVTRGSLNLVAFVRAGDGVSELSYSNNWMDWETFTFNLTKSWRIGYYLIDYRPTATSPDHNLPSPNKEAIAYQFFEKVTPMPDLSDPVEYVYLGTIIYDDRSFTYPNGTFRDAHELLLDLAERWEELAEEGDFYDAICGLYGGNTNTTTGQANGIMGNFPNVFVAHENRSWSFAHEIGHNWPTIFPHSWEDPSNPYLGWWIENSSITYGYDATKIWHPQEAKDVVKIPIHSWEENAKYGALMSYKTRWISPYEWETFMREYDPPHEDSVISTLIALQSSSPKIRVSGVIYNNNTGSLRPIFETQSFLNSTLPDGPYHVELRGPPPAEPLLYSQSFNISFESDACAEGLPPLDRAVFMLNLPYMSEAYSVSLWNYTVSPPILLDKITASPNPPSVTITYPNGGETLGDSFDVNWTAFDPDTGGDPLTFRLFYSNDNSGTWKPLSPRITGTNYTIDASRLPGGSQCSIRVVASDGFHTVEDQSDAVFNVPNKPPQDPLSYYQDAVESESYLETASERISLRNHPHSFGILKGFAFDPEDGVLQDSALSWSSDLEGPLGTGRVLVVTDLRPGTHNITLTATDSQGNNATDSFTLTVELHNLRVAQGSTDRTRVNLGQTVDINFTIANDGNVNETFDAYAYAISENPANPDLLIRNVSIVNLQPNTNTTITFSWNTTNSAYGIYSISCYVTPNAGELSTGDNYWAIPDKVFVEHEVWKVQYTSSEGYPIVDFAVYGNDLYAAADKKLYVYDGTGWSTIEAPTYSVSILPYQDKLIIGGQGGLYTFDGSSFSLVFSVATYIRVLGAYNGALYAGTVLAKPPILYYCNGSIDSPADWHVDTDFSTILGFSGPFGSIDSFTEYNTNLFVASGGVIYCYDGTGWSIVKAYDDVCAFLDMKVYDGKLYLATRDQGWRKPIYQGGTGFSGRVIEFDGENWTTIFDHDYWIYSLEAYDGKLCVGTANKICMYNGTDWQFSLNAVEGAYYAISMITYNGKIYVGMGIGYIFTDPAFETKNQEIPLVSEFPSFLILPLFMIATLALVIVYRRKRIGTCARACTTSVPSS